MAKNGHFITNFGFKLEKSPPKLIDALKFIDSKTASLDKHGVGILLKTQNDD